jgi:DNA (cytosine-5)-methyltransferase 1
VNLSTQPLKLIDTFSGIGGFSLAAQWLGGFTTTQFVEQDPYCQSILRKHFPDVPLHGDIQTYQPQPHEADIIVGGFPCQDISNAGNRAGIREGTRSGLFHELMRVVRLVRPRFLVLENVAAIINNGLSTVLQEVAEAGFDAEWACVQASDVGACHLRNRWWLVAYSQELFSDGFPSQHGLATPQSQVSQSGNHHWSPVAYSNSERLQERHPATIPDQPGLDAGVCPQTLLHPQWQSYVSQPVLHRGDDGLSNRIHRLKALGNAVVPQVAMVPLQRVLQLQHLCQ